MAAVRTIIYAIAGIALMLCIAAPASAQAPSQLAEISLTTIPATPRPGQNVTLIAQSFSIDLSQATITWTYGGKTVASGIGESRITVTAPAAGGSAVATVTATGLGADPVTASVLLNPGSMDLLWEAADAYTPPFYKGKAMLPVGGRFRVSAIPSPGAPRSLTYTWTRNGEAVPAASGYNRSSNLFENSMFHRVESLSIQAYGGAFQGSASLSVPTRTPLVLAYPKRSGFIDYAHGSAGDVVVQNGGAVLRFEPFFFSVTNGTIADTVRFELAVDDVPVPGDPAPNELRITRPPEAGTHELAVEVGTVEYSLQRALETFSLIFP